MESIEGEGEGEGEGIEEGGARPNEGWTEGVQVLQASNNIHGGYYQP